MDSRHLEHILAGKQIGPTAMRLLTLDFLLGQEAAVSLSDIENAFDHSDRVTLYRTLKTFEKKGLVHSIADGTTTRYALCDESCREGHHADSHLHFYCTSCGETSCLPGVSVPSVNVPPGFRLQEVNLLAKGICRKCVGK